MVASNFYDPMYSLSSDDDNNNNNNSNSNNPRSTSLVENVQVALGLLKQVRMALDNLSQQPPQSDLKQQALKKELTTWWEAQSQPMTQTQSKKQTSESDHYEKELVQFLEQSESELYTVLDKVSKNEYTFQMAERDEEIAYQRTKKQLDQLEKDIVEGYASMRGMLTSLLPPEKR